MTAYDETQRIATAAPPDAPTTQLRAPGPLDLAGAPSERPGEDATDVLRLDDLFEGAPATAAPAGPALATPPAPAGAAVAAPAQPARRSRTAMAERLLDNGARTWDRGVARAETWLRDRDNALMTVTALAAIVLILVIATLGH